ncbi:hypothetical protein [Streptomyces platensis]|nr:hypothetical protein OG229_17930 [Streptomyces platensis]
MSTRTHGRAATIDGSGHYPNMERPDLFNRTVGAALPALFAHQN